MATKNLQSLSQIKTSTMFTKTDNLLSVNSDKSRNVRGKQGTKAALKQLCLIGFLGDSNVAQGGLGCSLSFLDLQRHMLTGGTQQVQSNSEPEPDLEQPVLLPGSTWSDAVME